MLRIQLGEFFWVWEDGGRRRIENGKDNDEHTCSNSAKIKMPTAPWIKGPLLLQPDEVLDLSKTHNQEKNQQVEGGAIR